MRTILFVGFLIVLFGAAYVTYFKKTDESLPAVKNQTEKLPISPTGIIVLAAGDISCSNLSESETECQQLATAQLIEQINPEIVIVPGDLQYQVGTYENFVEYFDKSWGKFKGKIRPAAGNHEYSDTQAKGYYDYFNGVNADSGVAGDRDKGYYSYEAGDWHIIALNSNCFLKDGCDKDSIQNKWLIEDLKKSNNKCQLAYWHHPLISSGLHGDNPALKDLFQTLYDYKVELVITGHDHAYERLKKINSSGEADQNGVRHFIVGTGGRNLYPFLRNLEITESRQNKEFGVLKLDLARDKYSWEFVSVQTNGFGDSGSDHCL